MNAPQIIDGKWTYPDTWSDDQRRAWEGIQGRKIAETRALAAVQEETAAAAAAPDALIAAAKLEADDAQRERERAERAKAGEEAWRNALAERPGRVGRIDTADGDRIILRAMTRPECDSATTRATNLVTKAKSEAQAQADFMGTHRDAMLATVLHPDRERTKALTEKYPALWAHIETERDKLIDGRRRDEGKGSAP